MKFSLKPSTLIIFIATLTFLFPAFAQHHNDHHHDHSKMAESLTPLQPKISGKSLYNLKANWVTPEKEKIQLSNLQGKPQLVTMLYTSCATACPMLVDKMKGVRDALPAAEQNKLGMVLFSFDPKRDTPENLKTFASKRNLNLAQWSLLSPQNEGSANELAAILGVQFKRIKDDYVHSNIIFLLNSNGELIASDEGLSKASNAFIEKVKASLKEI